MTLGHCKFEIPHQYKAMKYIKIINDIKQNVNKWCIKGGNKFTEMRNGYTCLLYTSPVRPDFCSHGKMMPYWNSLGTKWRVNLVVSYSFWYENLNKRGPRALSQLVFKKNWVKQKIGVEKQTFLDLGYNNFVNLPINK